MCLLSLSILVASSPYLTLSSLIIICIYLLLRCLLSDMSGSLFIMVIMLSPLISRMLIYKFPLFNIIVVHNVIYLDDILVLIHSKWAGNRAHAFLYSLLFCLGLVINFFKSDLCLTQTFCFLGLCWDTVNMSVSLPPDKLADIQQLAHSLLQTQTVTVHWVMSFLGKTIFCASGHSPLWRLFCSFRMACLLFITLSPICFLLFTFRFQLYINWN